MPLYRSPDPSDWLILANNSMRIFVRKIGIDAIGARKSKSTIMDESWLDHASQIVLNRGQWFRDSSGFVASMISAIIKRLIDLLEPGAVNRRSYEAATTFMMGFNQEQYASNKKLRNGDGPQ